MMTRDFMYLFFGTGGNWYVYFFDIGISDEIIN